ncbi:GNAT family N-acetyltransferase [Virgibacillus sp. AGTR]|uniref:GNAT family N-acetyltransferase n=1 Tax=Virgibacillus salarius TaxID=447199 RepID=A0A941E1G6_9BACI|nr:MULTISPECIES: GNAT family N-acetyltransferase [Virgibacillus]MBR7797998.1 GNAT family N-acetyltransferase [Virgibacillus salarius]MCC2251381.1 GNAT family N-acetyltransferase [Virgibacillus sp. AGTR]NAZ10707.1 GNAT family N-acetyltransferase [Agaribacter marinus]QRZ16557.1 GNAT family N-acetyltransferase [Virgibacillus sp. AGTR]
MNIKVVTSQEEIEQAFYVRTVVFVDEQNVPPEEELDAHDESSTHFVVYDDDKPIAASRLRFVDSYGKLERICVLKTYRGKAIGKQLIQAMEAVILEKGYHKAKLNGQTHAEKFYQRLGYKTISGEFMDAGIPHVTMVKEL